MKMKKLAASEAFKRELKKLPKDVQEDFAKAFQDVAEGRTPGMEFEHLTNLGKGIKGVIELKINGSPAYRSVYVAKYNDTVYLLHAFTKTTNGVDRKAMATVVKRYREIPK